MNPRNPEWDTWKNTKEHPPIKEPGVYAIFAKPDWGKDFYLLYIGSTDNLHIRIRSHEVIRNIRNSVWDYEVVYWPCECPEDMEHDFIMEQMPLLNKIHK